jgi:hypothetical protein
MEMFPENAQWIWENFDHTSIEHLCEEKRNIEKFLDDEDNENDSSSKPSHKKNSKKQKILDKLNQEFLIYNNSWGTLYNLHGLKKEDYTEEEIQNIKNRQKRRIENMKKDSSEYLKEKEQKQEKFKDIISNNLEKSEKGLIKVNDEYMTEDQLENLSLEIDEDVFKFESEMIEEDVELFKSLKENG